MVKNPPANAGDMGFTPDLGRPPHAVEQLSLCVPQLLSLCSRVENRKY